MSYTITEERLLEKCFIDEKEEILPCKFEKLDISVATYVVKFLKGTKLNIETIFRKIPIANIKLDYVKKKDSIQILTVADPSCILLARYGDESRGNIEISGVAFRNQVTLIMSLEDKNVNIFVFTDCIKIAGAKNITHVIQAVKFFIAHIQKLNKFYPCYTLDPVIIDYFPVMTNANFQLGFKIDRALVDRYLLNNGYISIYEPSVNSGLYLKIPRKDCTKKFHTFTIFHTGCVLCSFSGRDLDEMREVYEHVVGLLLSIKPNIEKIFI